MFMFLLKSDACVVACIQMMAVLNEVIGSAE